MPDFDARVPRERLNQIAQKRLAQLGLRSFLGSDGQTLEGELRFRAVRLQNPYSHKPIDAVRFEVLGHDRLRLTLPPALAGAEIAFFDFESARLLEQAVGEELDRRAVAVRETVAQLQAMAMPARVDAERLEVFTHAETIDASFQLRAAPGELRVVAAQLKTGSPLAVPEDRARISISDYPHLADVEVYLDEVASQARTPGQPPLPHDTRPEVLPIAAEVEPMAEDLAPSSSPLPSVSTRGAFGAEHHRTASAGAVRDVTVGELYRRFGPDATLGGDWEIWAQTPQGTRRVASRDELSAELSAEPAASPGGTERPGYVTLMAMGYDPATAAAAAQRQTVAPAPAAPAPPLPPQGPVPSAGALWAMAATLVGDDGRTVVYRALNAAGQPAPQAASMAKAQFDASFVLAGEAYWSYVLVDRADEREVLYTPLDRAGRPAGPPRRMPTPHFTQTFMPSR